MLTMQCNGVALILTSIRGSTIKELLDKIIEKKLPLVVCRSKSGGAHVFLFIKNWIEAKVLQDTLTSISASLGYAGSEIFPKQVKLHLTGVMSETFSIFPIITLKRGSDTHITQMVVRQLSTSSSSCIELMSKP